MVLNMARVEEKMIKEIDEKSIYKVIRNDTYIYIPEIEVIENRSILFKDKGLCYIGNKDVLFSIIPLNGLNGKTPHVYNIHCLTTRAGIMDYCKDIEEKVKQKDIKEIHPLEIYKGSVYELKMLEGREAIYLTQMRRRDLEKLDIPTYSYVDMSYLLSNEIYCSLMLKLRR